MAKWIPMLTGALKEGAQKLLSVFTKTRESMDSADKSKPVPTPEKPKFDTTGMPEYPKEDSPEPPSEKAGRDMESLFKEKMATKDTKQLAEQETERNEGVLRQPREVEYKNEEYPSEAEHPDQIRSMPPPQKAEEQGQAGPDLNKYFEQDREAVKSQNEENRQEQLGREPDRAGSGNDTTATPPPGPERSQEPSSAPTASEPSQEPPTPETPTSSGPSQVSPISSDLPDLPDWPKAVMESSGMTGGPSFTQTGGLAASIPQAAELPGPSNTAVSQPQAAQPPGQPSGMMGGDQVVGGYSRTDKLLELMLLRGIPTLKPPRGP